MKIGILEANGPQNYRDWEKMVSYHPCAGASWIGTENGCFHLDPDFFRQSGGIFETGRHYEDLVLFD
jgi:hypothetical protein